MFKYEKMLEYPINIKKKDLKMAKLLADQLGGSKNKRDLHTKGEEEICIVSFLKLNKRKVPSSFTVKKQIKLSA